MFEIAMGNALYLGGDSIRWFAGSLLYIAAALALAGVCLWGIASPDSLIDWYDRSLAPGVAKLGRARWLIAGLVILFPSFLFLGIWGKSLTTASFRILTLSLSAVVAGPRRFREFIASPSENRILIAARRQRFRGRAASDPRHQLPIQTVLVGGQQTLGLLVVLCSRAVLGGWRVYVSDLPYPRPTRSLGASIPDAWRNHRNVAALGRRALVDPLRSLGLAALLA